MRFKYLYSAIAAAPVILFAFTNGSPVRMTGEVPGQDCSGCHKTFGPANSDSNGSVKLELLKPYNPGVAQHLKVTVQNPDATSWGFQLGARFINGGGNLQAGTFTPSGSDTKVVCDDGSPNGLPGPCNSDQIQWIEHANAPRTTKGAGYSFEFDWTPPVQENGDIIFYYSGVAADADGTAGGDHTYTGQMRIALSSSAACSISERPQVQTVVNAGPHGGAIAPNAMVEIYGTGFQPTARMRTVGLGDLGASPYQFPTELSCISVMIDGKPAPITYVQQDQINVQAPALDKTGPVRVDVIANPGRPNQLTPLAPGTANVQALAPSFFTFGATKSIAALFAGTGDIVANPAVVPSGKPAKPGDMVSLFGSGFGPTTPSWQAGQVTSGLSPLSSNITVKIGDTTLAPADVQYAGLAPQSISALYQFNVRIPPGTPDGDVPVAIMVNGVSTQNGATIPVRSPAQ